MRWPLSVGLALIAAVVPCTRSAAAEYDVVVYGGTASGVIAALAAAREGLRVALVEPKRHLGGMVAGGLSNTDVARREVISGYAHEFYRHAGEHYGMRPFGHAVAWN